MRRFQIGLIIALCILILGLCAFLGISLAGGRRHGGGGRPGIDVGSIDVGNIDTGDISVGHINIGDVDGEGGNYSLVLEEEVPAEGIRSLKLSYDRTFNDVLFLKGTGENILIREYLNFEPEDDQISKVEWDGSELLVKGAGRGVFFGFTFFNISFYKDGYTEVYLPEGCSEELECLNVKTVSGDVLSEIPFLGKGDFSVSTTSGDVFFPKVTAQKIQMSSTSGDIRLAWAESGKISVSTVSGDVMLDRAQGDTALSSTSGEIRSSQLEGKVRISTTSGDISLGKAAGGANISTTSGEVRLESCQGDLDVESTSGDIRVDSQNGLFQMETTSGELSVRDGSGWGRASSVSGDICVFLADLQGDLDISTTSGEVELKLPKEGNFAFHFDSTSGECRTFFDNLLSFNKKGNRADGQYGSGGGTIDISTTSGDLDVRAY